VRAFAVRLKFYDSPSMHGILATMKMPAPQKKSICRSIAILTALFAIAAKPSTRSHPGFEMNARPIHPMSIQPLVGDLAGDAPIIVAVDLEGSALSQSNRSKPTTNDGTVTATDGENGYVAYRHLGTTPAGLHVLIVMVSGGGSGVFEDVLWVKLVHDKVSECNRSRDRTMLVRVGQFTLGDRDDGEVKLRGTKLFIAKSRYREKDTIIALE